MNRLSVATFSLATAVAVMTLGYATPVFAEPPECTDPSSHPSCKDKDTGGKPKNETSGCQIDFSVTFDMDGLIRGDIVDSDNDTGDDVPVPYPDPGESKDKSGGGTGAGPGFRFDTNGKGPLESARDTRFLVIDSVLVPGHGGNGNDHLSNDHLSGADFRFHLPSLGLDLCSLDGTTDDANASSGEVPMTLRFVDDGGTEWMLLYDCIFHDTSPIINNETRGEPVTVTRNNTGAAGGWTRGDTWTITGTNACLISRNNYATATRDLQGEEGKQLLAANFKMTIEAQ